MAVRVTATGLEIGGKHYPLYSGEMHYWRIERSRWPDCLDRILELGFRFVSTYIPWSVHETARGIFDFGIQDPRKDIEAFLTLCEEKGLFVLVRPGPHINAELTYFGFPERLFSMPDVLSETADGTPAIVPAPPRFFPAPSYASKIFFEEVAIYFDAICPIIKRRLHPQGPVVGVQADNEMSLFFRTQAYDQDYSFQSIRLYHYFLEKKYVSIGALNRAYGHRHGNFSEVMPPREFRGKGRADIAYYLDWVEYKEYYIAFGVRQTAEMLRSRGLEDTIYFHNFPSACPTSPYDIPTLERHVDMVGVDIHASAAEYEKVRTGASFVGTTSRLGYVPELGAGGWPWRSPLGFADQKFAALAALMHGIKGFNVYMAVERERWYGAPVSRDGKARPDRFGFWRDLTAFLRESRFHEYRIHCEAALLCCREYERLMQATSLTGPVPEELLAGMPAEWFCPRTVLEGFSDPVQSVYRQQWKAFRMGLGQAGYSVAVTDDEVLLPTLEQYRMVLMPSFEYMNMALQRKLLVYALKGGVLVMGPRMPVYDEWMRADSKFALQVPRVKERVRRLNVQGIMIEDADIFDTNRGLLDSEGRVPAYVQPAERGAIIHLGFVFPDYTGVEQSPGLAAIMGRVAAAARLHQVCAPDDPLIDTRLHVRRGEKILFVANPTETDRRPVIRTESREVLEDIFTAERLEGEGGVAVPMPGRTVRVFRVR